MVGSRRGRARRCSGDRSVAAVHCDTRAFQAPRVCLGRLADACPIRQLSRFRRDDDYFFGVLHSRVHEVWALRLRARSFGKTKRLRYTPTTCFETFPFPEPTPEQQAAIAAAAKELDDLRTAG